MTDDELQMFRKLAEEMADGPTDWQWIGPHMSQRMFGITRQRALDYQARFGGEAKPLSALHDDSVFGPRREKDSE
jgi:hypothetical protein